MNVIIRFVHPLFSWAVFLFFGLEAIQRQLYMLTIIVALGLGGLSQTYWRSTLGDFERPYSKGDLIAFGIGLSAAVVYPILVLWSLFDN